MLNVDINVDRRTDGLTDGRTDGLTDGRTDGRKIGRLYRTLLQAGAIKIINVGNNRSVYAWTMSDQGL